MTVFKKKRCWACEIGCQIPAVSKSSCWRRSDRNQVNRGAGFCLEILADYISTENLE